MMIAGMTFWSLSPAKVGVCAPHAPRSIFEIPVLIDEYSV